MFYEIVSDTSQTSANSEVKGYAKEIIWNADKSSTA